MLGGNAYPHWTSKVLGLSQPKTTLPPGIKVADLVREIKYYLQPTIQTLEYTLELFREHKDKRYLEPHYMKENYENVFGPLKDVISIDKFAERLKDKFGYRILGGDIKEFFNEVEKFCQQLEGAAAEVLLPLNAVPSREQRCNHPNSMSPAAQEYRKLAADMRVTKHVLHDRLDKFKLELDEKLNKFVQEKFDQARSGRS